MGVRSDRRTKGRRISGGRRHSCPRMIIVGGIYFETVVEPASREWAGSGLRAAAALALRAERPILHAAIDGLDNDADEGLYGSSYEEVQMVAPALGVAFEPVRRSEIVGFRYVTPISPPSINGPNSRLDERITIQGDTALIFGMVEANDRELAPHVTAELVVLDPQRPRDAKPLDLAGIDSKRVVVVANVGEVRGLGRAGDLRTAAARVLEEHPTVSGVVTKRGTAGWLVSTRSGPGQAVSHETAGAHPTRSVWPIGSGDVFSAGLAHALDQGADLVEAARVGSGAAAHWCSTRVHAVPRDILAGHLEQLPKPIPPTTPTVYLAGPFFTISERWLVETIRDELTALGADVWSPVHEIGPGGEEVAKQDLAGLETSDVVLALLDHSDPGTVFEVGWAVKRGIPVVGYATRADDEGLKMMTGTSVELHSDLSTACYRAAWAGMGMRVRPGRVR